MRSFQELANLRGRVAVVTGGTGHLGRAMADALAELGANVVVTDKNEEECTHAAAEIAKAHGVRCVGLGLDLADEAAVRTLPSRVVQDLGRLDVLVNNAAFVGTSNLDGWIIPFQRQSASTWRQAFEVNLTAVFTLTQAAAQHLKASGHGCVINMASIYGAYGPDLRLYEGTTMGNPAAYAASKGGLIQFTRWCSTVLAPDIRVNAISPGGVFREQDERFVQRYVDRTPLGRMACEQDFKGVVCFLASDLSAYVTGQNLIVDGGFGVW